SLLSAILLTPVLSLATGRHSGDTRRSWVFRGKARFIIQHLQSLIGRGSRIRTGDLEYPKLPRYQTALCPACRARIWRVRYTVRPGPASRPRLTGTTHERRDRRPRSRIFLPCRRRLPARRGPGRRRE